jgi:ketosteroid isomerase-like protein
MTLLLRTAARRVAWTCAVGALLAACRPATREPRPSSPADVAYALLAADRAYATAARALPFRDALSSMFTDGVIMPAPPTRVLVGKAAVLEAFATSPDTAARVHWTPIRAGVSADGDHGFTIGFMVATRPDGSRAHAKYLAYWVRDRGQWRVAAWRRRPVNADVALDSAPLPPVLPTRREAPTRDADVVARHRRSLMAAEQGFSDEAQRIGVGAAFARFGDPDAVNVGLPTDGGFVMGPVAIARAVSGGQPLDAPATITWRADTALVASSGDLGITFGVIRPKTPPPGQSAAGASFFTIWRRTSPAAPWRYVAE